MTSLIDGSHVTGQRTRLTLPTMWIGYLEPHASATRLGRGRHYPTRANPASRKAWWHAPTTGNGRAGQWSGAAR